jgi:hypothetical protein
LLNFRENLGRSASSPTKFSGQDPNSFALFARLALHSISLLVASVALPLRLSLVSELVQPFAAYNVGADPYYSSLTGQRVLVHFAGFNILLEISTPLPGPSLAGILPR